MKKLWCMVAFVTFFGCSSKEEAASQPQSMSFGEAESAGERKLQAVDRRIIKEGEMSFETSSLTMTRKLIDEALAVLEGYVAEENEYTENDTVTQSLIVRVPAENFDKLVAEIGKGVTRSVFKRIEARDVTEEYQDIEIRLKIKRETENRYRELLARATTVAEILSIEKQTGELRAEIESIEGRLKYLQNRISYSTLTVTFFEKVSTSIEFFSNLGVSLKNGWNNFVWFLIGLINVWPFILGLMGITGILVLRRRKKTRNLASASSTDNMG